MSNDDIIAALETIKEVCSEHKCKDCPLGFRLVKATLTTEEIYGCILSKCDPETLNFNSPSTWRATKNSYDAEETGLWSKKKSQNH